MTTLDFAKAMLNKNVDYKMKAAKKLRAGVESGKRPSGDKMAANEHEAIKNLYAWLTMNILLGDDMWPIENLKP